MRFSWRSAATTIELPSAASTSERCCAVFVGQLLFGFREHFAVALERLDQQFAEFFEAFAQAADGFLRAAVERFDLLVGAGLDAVGMLERVLAKHAGVLLEVVA